MTFKKGKGPDRDPNILAKGRPKNFDQFRNLATQIANEIARRQKVDANGNITTEPITLDGSTMTVAEKILRDWSMANPELFAAYAFGRPPAKTEVTGAEGGPIRIKVRIKIDDEQ